jgi:hypothetical protein
MQKLSSFSAKGLCSHLAFSQPNRKASRKAVDIEVWLGKGFRLREAVYLYILVRAWKKLYFLVTPWFPTNPSLCRFSLNDLLYTPSHTSWIPFQINRSLYTAELSILPKRGRNPVTSLHTIWLSSRHGNYAQDEMTLQKINTTTCCSFSMSTAGKDSSVQTDWRRQKGLDRIW